MTGQLTPDLITPLLHRHVSASATCTSVHKGPVGNGQEIWFLSVTTDDEPVELVLRRTATSGPLDWTDREQEYAILKSLTGRGLPTPEVIWFAQNDELVRPYFVMQRLPGQPVQRESPETSIRLAGELGTWLARLHSWIPSPEGSGTSARDHTQVALQAWDHRYRMSRLGPVPALGALLAWLEVHQSEDNEKPVTLWGDPGPHNILHTDGVITGLLDWELSRKGHPLEDLGAAVWSAAGILDPELIVDSYEKETGHPVDRSILRYFEAMAATTRAIMLVTGVSNYVQGATRSPSLAGLGLYLLPRTLQQGAHAAGWPGDIEFEAAEPAQSVSRSVLRPDPRETLEGVAGFLAFDVLPAMEDPALRRGLKAAAALLHTTNRRLTMEQAVEGDLAVQQAALVAELREAGIDTSGDLETIAAAAERDENLARWRPRIRSFLLEELTVRQALIKPLTDLFEGRSHPHRRG